MTNEKNRGLKNVLKIFQYGFRKGHGTKRFNCSTDGAYLKGVQNIITVGYGAYNCCADCEKAFDWEDWIKVRYFRRLDFIAQTSSDVSNASRNYNAYMRRLYNHGSAIMFTVRPAGSL